ncbi:MAG: Calx-beta domain-containing protein, partial [Pirellulaceae bacterium]
TSSDTGEGTVPASVEVAPGQWETGATVTVTGTDDDFIDGHIAYTIVTGDPTSTDANYDALGAGDVDDVSVINTDDDTTTLSISGVSETEGTGGTTTDFVFRVTLSEAVQGGFRIRYATQDDTATTSDADYAGASGTLDFDGSAGEVHTVTVAVNQDNQVERDEAFQVALGDLSELFDPGVADSITIVNSPATGLIRNDETATVSFSAGTSTVIEVAGGHTLEVVLDVTGGGSLSEGVTVNVNDVLSGTAGSGVDYTLDTPSVTFAAGSIDGDMRTVNLSITADTSTEDDETIDLALQLVGDGMGGQVTLGTSNQHQVTIVDDPMTASVSGTVWADTNDNGDRDEGEVGLPGVTITLLGQTVERITMTGDDGSYQFVDLPSGTYDIVEEQPETFFDGSESLGSVAGVSQGEVLDDRFRGVNLNATEAAIDYDFGEIGLLPQYVTVRSFLASTPPVHVMIGQRIAFTEARAESEGEAAQTGAGVGAANAAVSETPAPLNAGPGSTTPASDSPTAEGELAGLDRPETTTPGGRKEDGDPGSQRVDRDSTRSAASAGEGEWSNVPLVFPIERAPEKPAEPDRLQANELASRDGDAGVQVAGVTAHRETVVNKKRPVAVSEVKRDDEWDPLAEATDLAFQQEDDWLTTR